MATPVTIGDIEVIPVLDLQAPSRDPGAIFTTVPAEAWNPYRSFALDSNGKWITEFRSHLVRATNGEGPVVLIDTAMGPEVQEHTGEPGQLLNNLAALGVQPGGIDAVVITHCHGDHIGWNIQYDDGGENPSLTFPNATYWIASRDWEHHTNPENPNPAFDQSVKPLEALGALRLVEGIEQIAPGVSTLPMNGHTPGHQCVLIQSGDETGVIIGDLFHNVAQVTEQTWCPTFDWNTDMSTHARRSLLTMAATDKWTVFAGHLPDPINVGKVVSEGGKSSWEAL
ncbi:MAG: MBL fold metallo-hydrolase [Dehalococcoidia bacterium]|jgi:glyoxylase-like metal-dependent hydrolase (beta-lactamase superfamily II)|nr:MBL fold metallo-hydrolase [Dehalococcoidia bacterium]